MRWQEHKTNRENSKISNSIKLYGKENFTFEVIDGANSFSELNYRETHWIHYYDSVTNGYNLNYGGNSKTATKETRKKISEIVKNNPGNKKHLAKLCEEQSKTLYQYDLEGNFIRTFKNSFEAGREIGIFHGAIRKGCRKGKPSGGFRWSHKLEEVIPHKRKEYTPKGPIIYKGKGVGKLNELGEVFICYLTAKEAARENNCKYKSLIRVCQGEYKQVNNMKFVYLTDRV